MKSSDWEDLSNAHKGLTSSSDNIVIKRVDDRFIPTDDMRLKFPKMTQLLGKARITQLSINNTDYVIFGWTHQNGCSLGWLCSPPVNTTNTRYLPEHRVLLANFGGIDKHWGDSEGTWLINLNGALSEKIAKTDFAEQSDFFGYFSERCKEESLRPNLNAEAFTVFALEANGNFTAYHRYDGQVIMFAHDHCFDHLRSFPDCPEYSFYKIDGCATFGEWVEIIANQWLKQVA
jgi:hypothetical protein